MNPLVREIRILYYRWAVRDLRITRHPAEPLALMRLTDLLAMRPRVRLKNRCERSRIGCARDHRCGDLQCPGHPGAAKGDGSVDAMRAGGAL